MMPPIAATAGLVLALSSGAAAPIDTLEALGHALTACFQAPAGSAGSQITVLISLKRDGSVLGKPRITFSHLVGTAEEKQAFVAAALGALKACTPVAVTSGLGSAIAGRPLSIRYVGGGPSQGV